jgi:hypothetical protein
MAMSTKSTRILTCIAAAAALFIAAGPPAQAGNWGGKFDPTGAVIGFNGTDLINVSGTDCLMGSLLLTNPINFFYVNNFSTFADTSSNNCTAALLNASVTLQSDGTDTAQLIFSAPAIGTDSAIWGLDISQDGTLLGVDSFPIGPVSPSGDFNPIFAGPWFITLSATDGECSPFGCPDPPPTSTTNVVTLNDGVSFTSDPYTFAAVPEPGSLALLAGALGAGWLTRRRKAAA